MISICLCIGYSLFGSSSLSTKGKRRFYICVLVQRKIAVWVAKKPDIFGLFARDIFFVSTLWRRWLIRSARFRARRHARGRRNSHRLFLCFATAFSNLSACTNKKSRRQKAVGIFGADVSFARLASALADTHAAVETATGCFFASQPPFRISPPAPIKNPVGKKPSGFLAQMAHSLGSLPRSPTRTRPSKQPPAVSLLHNRLFKSLRLHQ